MHYMIEITDCRSFKRYKAKDIKTVAHRMPDEHGDDVNVKCVELTIIGNNHEWRQWFPYDEFAKVNPEVEIQV